MTDAVSTDREAALASALEAYARDGFAVIRGVLDPDTLAEASAHVEWLMAKYPDLPPEHLHHPLVRQDAYWSSLVCDPRLVDIAAAVLGPDLACFTGHYICKPARTGMDVLWHQDGAYWKLEPNDALAIWVAVDESTPENGCLRMLPGTHREPLRPIALRDDVPNLLYSSIEPRWVDESRATAVVLRPGDVSIHHPNMIHGSGANRSAKRRCGLDIGYIATSTRVANRGLYQGPLLVRGRPRPGVNRYRAWPEYVPGRTIAFAGRDAWNERARAMNAAHAFVAESAADGLTLTRHMLERLREGSVQA